MQVLKFILQAVYPWRFYLLGPVGLAVYWALDASAKSYLIKLLVNATNESSKDIAIDKLWQLAPYFVLIQIISPLMWRLYDWCTLKYEPELKNNISKILSEKIFTHSHSFFQKNYTGSLANKISDAMNFIPSILYTIIVTMLHNFLTIIITFFALYSIHKWFAISFITWAFIFIMISLSFTKKSRSLSSNAAEANSKVIGQIVDYLSNISSVRLFNGKKYELSYLKEAQNDYLIAAQRRRWFQLRFYSTQGMIFAVYQILCLFILGKLFSLSKITSGDFAMILTLNIMVIESLWQLCDEMRDFNEYYGVVNQALCTIYQQPDIKDVPEADNAIIKKGSIVFDHVNFRYNNSDVLFKDKSLSIKTKEKVGLVGYSGSGKSTFVNLILRIFDIESGKILIDNKDIKTITQKSLRSAISLIPQDPSLFNRSIYDNIRYGKFDASDSEVIDAAKNAYAHDFIMNLPEGYETQAGEKGIKLSGGQRQRISIARAILKNAPILIFDEATSSLDSITESLIKDSVNQLMQDKTTLIIAHRLSTIMNLDRILVFDNGEIIQDGNHRDLIAQNGLYKTLWEAQELGIIEE